MWIRERNLSIQQRKTNKKKKKKHEWNLVNNIYDKYQLIPLNFGSFINYSYELKW